MYAIRGRRAEMCKNYVYICFLLTTLSTVHRNAFSFFFTHIHRRTFSHIARIFHLSFVDVPIGHMTRHTKLRGNAWNQAQYKKRTNKKHRRDNTENGENILLIISAVSALSQLAPCSMPTLFCITFLAPLSKRWNFLHHFCLWELYYQLPFFSHDLSLCFSICLKLYFSILLPHSSHLSTDFLSNSPIFILPIHACVVNAVFIQPVRHPQTYIGSYHKTQRHSVQCQECVASSEYLSKLLIQPKIHIIHCLSTKDQPLIWLFISYTEWLPKKRTSWFLCGALS